jgi:LPS export ABC transporter permease LptG/LPS export ABC transporter permease LptF
MPRTLDRYVIREAIPPFLLALLIVTFLLVLPPVMQHLENLLAKGVTWTTAARILWTAVPQALGLTIPMSLLVGLLVGLGRLSADRESVALLACGVSPYRLLRPVLALGLVAAAATFYVMVVAIPDANQTFRELTFDVISKRVESDIRPRVFFQDFPGWVLYARDEPEPGTPGWKDLYVADATSPGSTTVYLARRGHLVLNREARTVRLVLSDGTQYAMQKPGQPNTFRFENDLILSLNPDQVFKTINLQRGPTEKTIADLRATIAEKVASGISPHPEILALQQKFSLPVACLVFAVVALALGLTVSRDTKMAGFVVGIAVIFVYYVILLLSESYTKGYYADPASVRAGHFALATSARWIPNLVLGLFGIAALIWRARFTEARLPFGIGQWASRAAAAASDRLTAWKTGRTRRQRGAAAPVAAGPARPSGPVVVIRVPRLHLPMPGLIDRYVAGSYLRVAGLSFVGLLGLFYLSTFIDRSDKVFKGQATTAMVGQLLVYMTPQFVYYVIPIATLLAALVTFGLLSKTSELTVLKACGVSLYRAAASVVLISLGFSAVLFALDQQLMARANRRADELDNVIRGRPPKIYDSSDRRWVVGRSGAIYHYTFFDTDRDEFSGLVIYRPDPASWTLATMVSAPVAQYVPDQGWIARTGWIQNYTSTPPTWQSFSNHPVAPLEPPDYFKAEQPMADMMTVQQLRRYVAELASSGVNVIPLEVDLQKKLAFPFVTLVMTLLAVPFGVTTGRRGTLYGIGLAIVIALSYWIVISAFVAVGKGGLISPFLAGWAPNIMVASLASYLLLTART